MQILMVPLMLYALNAYSKRVTEAASSPAIAGHPAGQVLIAGLTVVARLADDRNQPTALRVEAAGAVSDVLSSIEQNYLGD
jgi:hypothetical protein